MPRAGWLAVGAIAAALGAGQMDLAASVLLAVAAVAAAGAALAGGRRRPGLLAIGAALVLARAALGIAAAPPETGPQQALEPSDHHRAVVVSLYAPQAGQQRAILELLPPEPDQRVYGSLPRYPSLAPYDEVEFEARLELPDETTGFGQYLVRSGIGYSARIREMVLVGRGDTALADLEQLRRAASDLIARVLPAPQSGLATGMLIGLRDAVPRDVADDFRTSGLSHVVAISGYQFTIVVALAGLCLRWLPRRGRASVLLALIWAYALVAGAAPGVLRAASMATVVIGAREAGRQSQAPAALGLAALAMLLVEPAVVADIGFQLSLAATAGLLVWAGPLNERLSARLPRLVPRLLVEGMAVSLAAQAATMPLVLLHFGRLSTVAPLANLLVTPLVAPAMVAGMAALAVGALVALGLPAVIIAPISMAGALCLGGLIWIAELSAALPLASITLTPPLDLAGALLAAGLLVGWLRRTGGDDASSMSLVDPLAARTGRSSPAPRRVRRLVAAGLGALLAAAVLVGAAQPDGRLRMIVLDVGQGDAILLVGPRGGRILVDSGPDPDLLLARLDERLPAWDRRLDLVVLSHPHEDHVAGLALLLDRYRIGAVAENGMTGLGPGDAAYRRRLTELGRETRILAAGDRIELDGIAIEIRWPLRGRVPLRPTDGGRQVNNVSLVLDFTFGQRRFLLTGDVEEQIDPQLLAQGIAAAGRPLDVLKVAHHGSATATTDAFVEQLDPGVAVISAGLGNPYGHPSPRTVERLRQGGSTLYRTDLDGTVEVSTDGQDLRTQAAGGRPPPTPRTALAPGIGFCPIPGT